MADSLAVQAELTLKDSMSKGVQSTMRRVAEEGNKVKTANTQIAKSAKEAGMSMESVARNARAVGNVPFTTTRNGLRSVEQQARKTQGVLKALGGAARDSFSGVQGQVMALGGAAIAAGSLTTVVSMDDRMVSLRSNTNKTASEMQNFKNAMNATAGSANVSRDAIMSQTEVLQDLTGDYDYYTKNMMLFAKVQKAAGAAPDAVGRMGAALHQMNIKDPQQLQQTFSGLIEQGDKGAFTFRDFAQYATAAVSQYSALGQTGKKAALDLNTSLQLAMKSTGNAPEAVTATQGLMRDIQAQAKKLKKLKIEVYDKAGNMRALPDIQKDIIRATKGDARKFNKLGFSDEGKKAMNYAMGQYKQTGNFAFMDEFTSVTGESDALNRKWQQNSQSISSGLTAISNAWQQLSDSFATEPLRKASAYITGLDSDTRVISTGIAASVLALGAVFAKAKLASLALNSLKSFRAAPTGSASTAVDKAAAIKNTIAKGGPLPLKLPPANATPTVNTTPILNTAPKGSPVVAGGKKLLRGGALNALFAGVDVVSTENDETLTRAQKNVQHSGTAGGLVGGLAGAKGGAMAGGAAGAMLGSFVPIIGNAVGAAVGAVIGGVGGGILGYLTGDAGGRVLGEKAFSSETAPQQSQQPIIIENKTILEVDGSTLAEAVNRVNTRDGARQ